jgi:hypothetical protein
MVEYICEFIQIRNNDCYNKYEFGRTIIKAKNKKEANLKMMKMAAAKNVYVMNIGKSLIR